MRCEKVSIKSKDTDTLNIANESTVVNGGLK